MQILELLGLNATHNPFRWNLPVTERLCTPERFLFGGCGLSAAIAALEATTERPVVWATAQYLSYASAGSVVDLDVTVPVSGRNSTQARLVGHVHDREIFTVNAALGTRPLDLEFDYTSPIDVPDPEECPARIPPMPGIDSIMSHLDVRLASARTWDDLDGTPAPGGRSAVWVRIPSVGPMGASGLAILGDYVPFGIGQALGVPGGGNSLDNTLRVVHRKPAEWVLVDIQVEGIAHGFGHGSIRLYDQDRTLLAIASQSTIVRLWTVEKLEKRLDAIRAAEAQETPDGAT
ncbi:MAG: thioesterase family protein [Acidimicrobiales bacterium]|nr:thioesterase family protein [Acidimicrobiales bacterium]